MKNKIKTILAIDDEDINLKIIEGMLIPMGYKIITYKSAKKALEEINKINPDVVLLDIMMPEMNGFDFLKKIREIAEMKNIPVVMVTALDDVQSRVLSIELGADDFLSKPIDKLELRARVKSLIKVKDYYDYIKEYNKILEEEVKKRTQQIQEGYRKLAAANKVLEESFYHTVLTMFDLISNFDENLGGHCKRVAVYASMIMENLGIESKQNIKIAALLHDIGLLGVPKDQLFQVMKGEHVNDELDDLYKKHPLVNLRSFEEDEKYKEVLEIIAAHHENIDGSGFPKGLKEQEIPIGGKIIAVANYYDSLRYEDKKLKEDQILEKVEEKAGKWFDKFIFETFKEAILKKDPFSNVVEMRIEDLTEGVILAEPIISLDTQVIIISSQTMLDAEKLKKIKGYALRFNLKEPIKVYKNN